MINTTGLGRSHFNLCPLSSIEGPWFEFGKHYFPGDVKLTKYYGQWKQLMETIYYRLFVCERCMTLTCLVHVQST